MDNTTPHLPNPGDLDWGDALNTFLRVSHAEDGTLKQDKVLQVIPSLEADGTLKHDAVVQALPEFGTAHNADGTLKHDAVRAALPEFDVSHNTDGTLKAAAVAAVLPHGYAQQRTVLAQTLLASGGLPVVMTSPPTVTESSVGAATAVSNPITYSKTTRPDVFTVYGANLGLNADPSYYLPNSVKPGGSTAFQPYAVEMQTDAPKLEISVRANGMKYRIGVDGQLTSQNGSALSSSSGGNIRIIINFSGVRKMRTIRFESDAVRMAGWTLSKTDTVLPARYRGPRCIVVGDSIVEGSGAAGRYQSWSWLFGSLMGWGDVWSSGSGGTGYLVDGSPTFTGRTKIRDRLGSDVIPWAPQVVVLAGGRNDLNYDPALAVQQINGCLDDLRAALPNALLYVVSPLFLGNPVNAALNHNTAYRDAVQAHAAGARFIDLLNPVLFGGTGKAGATKGDGPADVIVGNDGVHPTQDGHMAIARAVAAKIAADLGA